MVIHVISSCKFENFYLIMVQRNIFFKAKRVLYLNLYYPLRKLPTHTFSNCWQNKNGGRILKGYQPKWLLSSLFEISLNVIIEWKCYSRFRIVFPQSWFLALYLCQSSKGYMSTMIQLSQQNCQNYIVNFGQMSVTSSDML